MKNKHMTILLDTETAFGKKKINFIVETFRKLELERHITNKIFLNIHFKPTNFS